MIIRELTRPPDTGRLLGRAALDAVLGVLPGQARQRGGELPELELVLPQAVADPARLADYSRVCGFDLRDELPMTYPQVMAFPLAMRLLTDSTFPFPVVGLVHVANTITQSRPLRLGEPVRLLVRAVRLRPHQRGVQFDVEHEASAAGELAWRGVSTYLRRGGAAREQGSGGGAGSDSSAPAGTRLPAQPSAVWRLPADLGRRYAGVSGDRNPIHLSAVTARAFGFPRAIAHGMWSAARCLAALGAQLPAAGTVDVTFRRPVLLPATVALHTAGGDGGWSFELRDGRGRPHLCGTVTPLRGHRDPGSTQPGAAQGARF